MSTSPDPRQLRIADYTYDLPSGRIARYPLPQRDGAKLLVYRNAVMSEDTFSHLPDHIPEGALLVVNNARVVRARMIFRKPTGGAIEIFCLEPYSQYPDIAGAMSQTGEVLWLCLVGGAAKWKKDVPLMLDAGDISLQARIHAKNAGGFIIHFTWVPEERTFAEVLEAVGQIPLPPYLGRAAEASDDSRYQTLFAENKGSVAAPTASLHFTETLRNKLLENGVRFTELTLHVGAGTFMPVKSELAGGHQMHYEWVEVSGKTISDLLETTNKPVIAGGTTALRTIESLYWMGCRILRTPEIGTHELIVDQWEAYEPSPAVTREQSLRALLSWMEQHQLDTLIARTGIMIAPGYRFRIADALITNFHQPQSTLLLLVAAFIGDDWRRVYDFAMQHHFRFLSYGDGSLLWKNSNTGQ